jgi:hypothetical protein
MKGFVDGIEQPSSVDGVFALRAVNPDAVPALDIPRDLVPPAR